MKKIQKTRNFLLTFTSVTVKGVGEMKRLSILLVLIMMIVFFSSCAAESEIVDTSVTYDRDISEIRVAEQKENEKYRYSSIVVAIGEEGIHPIKCALGSTHYVNGEERETGCSDGVWYLFNNPETDPNDFPTLVLNGKVELYAPTHITYNKRVTLYDMNYEFLDDSKEFENLSDLPAGEYLVVFSEYESGEVNNPQDYWKTHWENVFKLIVRS